MSQALQVETNQNDVVALQLGLDMFWDMKRTEHKRSYIDCQRRG